MSTEMFEKLLGQVYQDGLVVYDHVRDPVYRFLGYTQVGAMIVGVCALAFVTIPLKQSSSVYWAYQKMDDALANQYQARGIGVDVLNYVVWLLVSVLCGSFVGKKIGSGLWASYCLLRTRCQSRHTMDLPLSQLSLQRVTKYLLRNSLECDPNDYAMLLNPVKIKEMKQWLHQVNLFFTAKRLRDLQRGKVQAAESWWLVKKRFYNDYKVDILAAKLMQYENDLRVKLHRLRQHMRDLQEYQGGLDREGVLGVKAIKRDFLRWLVRVIDDFDKSVGVRHEKRSLQSIFQDRKQLSHLFDELSACGNSVEHLQRGMKQAVLLMQRVEARIRTDQTKIPVMPDWLLSLIEVRVVEQSEARCFRSLSDFFNQSDDVLDRMSSSEQQAFCGDMKARFDERMSRLRKRLPRKSKSVSFSSNDSVESQEYETARCISERPLLNAMV
jgi:hypothetical protein